MNFNDLALWCVWSSFLVAALSGWPIYRLLLKLKSRQTVSQYAPETHQVKQGTPTMGGLIPVAGFLVSCLVLVANSHDESFGSKWIPFSLAASFALIGFLDDFVVPRVWKDKRGLGWKQKILLQLVFATAAIFLADSRFASPLGLAIGVIVVLFFSNAFNFADGLDGLSGSLGILLCAGFAMLGLLVQAPATVIFAAALGAALIPFLYMNAPPAKVFMGDVGSLPIGAVLGFLALDVWRGPSNTGDLALNGPVLIPVAILSLVMVAEIVPPPLQIFWVKVFKKRLFLYTPIHHGFEKKGWPESRVVWLFGLTQLVLVMASVSLALVLRGSDS